MDEARFDYRRETVVRKSIAEMLSQASERLKSKGYRLGIIEGWLARTSSAACTSWSGT